MPYRIETDNPECREGYAVVKESDGELIFCHKTRREAKAQIAAIELSENYRALPQNYRPASSVDVPDGRNCKNCVYYAGGYCNLWSANVKANYYCNKWAGSATRAATYATTEAMKAEARRGLEWRATFGRGGTPIGVASARDIIAGSVTYSRVLRIRSFLARHEIDKQGGIQDSPPKLRYRIDRIELTCTSVSGWRSVNKETAEIKRELTCVYVRKGEG